VDDPQIDARDTGRVGVVVLDVEAGGDVEDETPGVDQQRHRTQ